MWTNKGNSGSTGNFIKHYKTSHGPRFKDLDEYLKKNKSSNTHKIDDKRYMRQPFISSILKCQSTEEVGKKLKHKYYLVLFI